MEFDAVNSLSESSKNTQGQQNKEKDDVNGVSFFDTINAKAAESEAETTSDYPTDGKKGDYALPWGNRQMSRGSRRNEMWIEQVRRRRIQMEHQAWVKRHEEYVKMLKASSLKRSLQESSNRRYAVSSVARDVALNAYGIEYQKKYGGFF